MREAYGPMGRGGMPGYGTMPFGMQGFGFQGEERKRRRPPSLLLDESPLKVTLRVNSIKRVHPDKTRDDRATEAFNTLRDAYELLADSDQRARYDKQLAKDDEARRRQREKRRAATRRAAYKALRVGGEAALKAGRALAVAAMANKRVAAVIVALLWLLFAVPPPDPAAQPL